MNPDGCSVYSVQDSCADLNGIVQNQQEKGLAEGISRLKEPKKNKAAGDHEFQAFYAETLENDKFCIMGGDLFLIK